MRHVGCLLSLAIACQSELSHSAGLACIRLVFVDPLTLLCGCLSASGLRVVRTLGVGVGGCACATVCFAPPAG